MVSPIFEGSYVSLGQWLKIIDLMHKNKNGINVYHIHKKVGVTYKTTWYAVQRIRYAMDQSQLKQKIGFFMIVDIPGIETKKIKINGEQYFFRCGLYREP